MTRRSCAISASRSRPAAPAPSTPRTATASAAAVGLAARLWQSATLGDSARQALIKLRAAGTEIRTDANPGAVPQVDASDPSLPTLLEAARTATTVTFDYTKSGARTATTRRLEPWGVLSWRRRWYVAGRDLDRGEPRSFRLSRISGAVETVGEPGAFERPPHVDLLGMVADRGPDDGRTARVRVSGPGTGGLRRIAQDTDGDDLSIGYTDVEWLARLVASAGASAQVLEPPELVEAVVRRLRASAGLPAVSV